MGTKMSDIIMGYSCNNDCMHCIRGNKDRDVNLSYSDVIGLVDEAKKRGTAKIILQGGEPTIRKDFLDILRYVRRKGFKEIQMQSNGRMFAYPSFAEEVAENNITEFCISMHNYNAKKHDAFTGVKGSYNQTIEGIKNLIRLKQFVRILIVLTRKNYKDLRKIVDVLLNLHVQNYQIGIVIPEGNAINYFDDIVPRLSDVEPYLLESLGFLKRGGFCFNTQDIPRCFLGEFEKSALEVPFVYAEKLFPEVNVLDSEKARRDKKVVPKECKHFSVCEGVYKEYAKRFGVEELRPVK